MSCLQAVAIIVRALVATAAWWVVGCELAALMAHQAEAHSPGPSSRELRLDRSIVMRVVPWYSLISAERSGRHPGEGLTWALPSTLTAAFSPEGEAPVLLPYQFQMEEIESFRYRCRVSSIGGEEGSRGMACDPGLACSQC